MTLTFQEFQSQVQEWHLNADANGHFENDKSLVSNRVYYSWTGFRVGSGAAVYDSANSPSCWLIDNGRGCWGRGKTWEEADKDEKEQYDESFCIFNNS